MTTSKIRTDNVAAGGAGAPVPTHTAVGDPHDPPRVWLHDVEAEVLARKGELEDLGRTATDERRGTVTAVRRLLRSAEDAARGRHPHHRWVISWWSGDCIEAAYRSLHRAEAELAKLYDEARCDAALPGALSRLRRGIGTAAPEYVATAALSSRSGAEKALGLSQAIQIGHEVKDQQYAKVRRFRNIVLVAAVLILFFVVAFAVLVSVRPGVVPMCFVADNGGPLCPTGPRSPSSFDVWVVVVLGFLGGSLAAAVSIRNIRGTPTPYNLATALAVLKVPAGALTALGALVLIAGHIVPGLSDLDSPSQILAYALVFGYSQQLLTGLIDRRAVEITSGIHVRTTDLPQRRRGEAGGG